MGARAPRRRARPREHQGRLARVREDRRSGRASASSATSRSARPSATRSSLRLYDAVVYTVGAQTDRRLGIPGEDLPGSWPATEFVAWYNGHPDFQDREFDLSHERAVVVGNGNVAIDVRPHARADRRRSSRRPTRRTTAIEAIVGAGVEEIVMLGRRGPVQAAFTPPELKELGELAGADVIVDPADLVLDAASAQRARPTTANARAGTSSCSSEFAARPPAGQAAPDRAALPRLAGRDPRRRPGRGGRGRAQRARRGGRPHRRAVRPARREVIPCRPRPAQRRLPGRARCRACRSTSAAARSRTTAAASTGARAHVLRRLDQARPERRDRHEQEGRDRDGRAAARGRARRPARDAAGDGRRSPSLLARARREVRRLRGLAGDRRRRARAPASRSAARA